MYRYHHGVSFHSTDLDPIFFHVPRASFYVDQQEGEG